MASARLAWLWWTVGAGLVGLGPTGCALAPRVTPSPTMTAALDQAEGRGRADVAAELRAGLAARQTFGYAAPYVPVVLPPEVRRVWVPTHENAEGELVSGHWVYLRFTDFRWFTDAAAGSLGLGGRPTPGRDDATPPPWPSRSSTAPAAVPWTEAVPPAATESRTPAGPAAPASTGPTSELPWTGGLPAPRVTAPAPPVDMPRGGSSSMPILTPPGR